MKNKKPTYEDLKKELAEAERLIARLQENRINIDKHEHDTSLLSTKELAEAFIASEQNFKNSMDESPLGVRIVTEDGELIYANKAALNTFGHRTVEELAAVKRSELYTPESFAAHQERRKRRKLKEYVPGEYEISIKRPNGEIRNLMVYRREVMWGGEQQFMAMYEDITKRKRAEEALRESEDRFHSIVEHGNDAIVFIEEGMIQYCNSKMLEISGYTAEEIIGKSFVEFVAPEQRERAIEIYRKRIAGEKVPERYELSIISKSGSIVYTEISASLFTFKHKMVDIVILRDITERRKVIEALRQSEEMFAKAFRSSPDAISIVTFDDESIIIDTNDAAVKSTGYSFGELIGHSTKGLNLWVKKEDRESMRRLVEEKGRINKEEYQFRRKSGEIRIWEFSAEPITVGGRKCLLSVQRDITEQKQAEEALRESEEKFAKAFYNSPSLMAISTIKDGRIVEVNDIYCRVTGFSREELIGRTTSELNLWYDPAQREAVVKTLQEKGIVQNSEVQMRAKTGETQTINLSTAKIMLKNEPCLLTIADNITERKKTDEQLSNEAIRRRILIEQSRDGIVILDEDGKVYEANHRFTEMLGYSPEEVRELHVWDWAVGGTRKRTLEMMRDVDETGDHFETQHRRKDGTILDVEISTNGAIIAGQKLVFCVCRDITERKQAEEALHKQQSFLSNILTSIQDGISVLDSEFNIIQANGTMEKLYAHAMPLTGKKCYEAYQNRTEPCEICPTGQTYKNRRAAYEVVPLTGEGGEITGWLDLYSFPLIDTQTGEMAGAIEYVRDISERRRAEERLKESEARFRALFETMAQGVVYQDAGGKIISANPAAGRILGLTIDQILGRESVDPRWKSIHENGTDFPGEEHPSMVALRTGKPVENVVMGVFNPISDEYRWILINATPEFREDEETPYRSYTTFTDITEQKNAEKALQESEERYHSIFENSKDAILLTSPINGKILAANPEACRMFGRSEEEICRIGRQGIIDYSDPRLEPALEKRRTTGEFTGELTFIRADGTKFPGDISTRIFYDKDGKEKTSMIIRDITERKRMAEALEEERKDIKLIIDSSPILVFYKDLDGILLRVNKAFATALNMAEEDFLGKTVYDLYSKPIAQGMTVDDNEVFKSGRSKINIIEQYESASGLRWVQTDKIPIFDKDNKAIGLVGFAQDITERKRAEEALISSETRYRRLFESAKDGILILNAETGQIIDANPFLLNMLGFSFNELTGKELWEIGLFKDIAVNKARFDKLEKYCKKVRVFRRPKSPF